MPYIEFAMMILMVGRFFLIIISQWYPSICKSYYFVWLLILAAKETAPVDFGVMWEQFLRMESFMMFAAFSSASNLRFELIGHIITQAYLYFYVRYAIYGTEEALVVLLFKFFIESLIAVVVLGTIHLIINAFGLKYIEAELPRDSNDKLLNNLKEGVFIISKQDQEIQFQNTAATRMHERLMAMCELTLI